MCGRFALTDSEDKIIFSLGLHNSKVKINPRYNIYPSEKIPVILKQDGLLYLDLMVWGFIPFWSKTKTPLINAKVETIKEKPSFRQAISKRRCLIPANGFYEWNRERSKKQPYYISYKNNNLLAFAGIWEDWILNDREKIRTCCILTSLSNSFMLKIHNRMPLIITQNNFDMWLDFSEISLKNLNASFQSDSMQAWKVSKKVNSTKFDNPHCIKKIVDNEKYKDVFSTPEAQGKLFD